MKRDCRWLKVVLAIWALHAVASPPQASAAPPDLKVAVSQAFDARARHSSSKGEETIVCLYDQDYTEGSAIVGANLVAYEQSKIREFHQYAAGREMEFTDVKVELRFEKVDRVGPSARVEVTEGLVLTYHYPHKDENPGVYTTMGLGMTHAMDLALIGDQWLIRRDDYIDAFRQWLRPDHVTPRYSSAIPSGPHPRKTVAGRLHHDP